MPCVTHVLLDRERAVSPYHNHVPGDNGKAHQVLAASGHSPHRQHNTQCVDSTLWKALVMEIFLYAEIGLLSRESPDIRVSQGTLLFSL